MRIKHHCQQQVAHGAFQTVFLVHQLMAVIDPDRARDHAHAEEHHEFLKTRQVVGIAHIPDQREEGHKLHRSPDPGDHFVKDQVIF